MASKPNEGVRIGPISLLTLISVLLLAVLAMLCVTTANASRAMSRRQADAATSSYRIESCGQALIAELDDVAHANGTDAASAVSSIAARLDTIKQAALDTSEADDLDIDAKTDGSCVTFSIAATDGRRLDACITFNDDLTYTVDQWKVTTTQSDQAESDTLWTGSDSD